MTSSMAWYPLPKSGGSMSAGDEFFENQSAGWSLWSFSTSEDPNSENRGDVAGARCGVSTGGPSEDQSDEDPAPFEKRPPQFAQPTSDDIFMSQFSEEEMERMDGGDGAFEALDMFPDSMHRLLSYENMLTGVLTGPEEDGHGRPHPDHHNGVDTMDTCGFPLFSHDLQGDYSRGPEQSTDPEEVPGGPSSQDDKAAAGLSTVKRGRPVAGTESATPGFEALVLEELEDVVFQLTKRTRICYRDAFYRLAAESSKAISCGAAKVSTTSRQSSQLVLLERDDPSRSSTTPGGCPERETNPIDRTVMVLTMEPPHQLHGNCFPGDGDSSSGADLPQQSTASWAARA